LILVGKIGSEAEQTESREERIPRTQTCIEARVAETLQCKVSMRQIRRLRVLTEMIVGVKNPMAFAVPTLKQ
jgi:hypothetical protein